MDVEVYYGGRRGGTMPYTALPAFRLFCKQNGFQLKWDPKNKRVDLDSLLKGKVCVLHTGASSQEHPYEKEIVEKVQRFVSEYRMEVISGKKSDVAASHADVAIRISVKEMRLLEKPKIILFQPDDRRELAKSLQSELKQTGMPCVIKASKVAKPGNSAVHLQLQIPQFTEIYKRKTYGEKIAFYLASGILHYFQEDLRIQPLAYLPPNLLKVFLDSVMAGQSAQGQASPGDDFWESRQETDAAAPQYQEQQDELEGLENIEADAPDANVGIVDWEELVESGEDQLVLTIHDQAGEEAEPPAAAEPIVHHPAQVPLQPEKRLAAEVFFDYTLIHSDSPDRPYLLIGTLQVKNTGTEDLYNPIVCLRVTPADSIKMGGQVLPPRLVETLAVQGDAGMKGWRYLDDDWFSQAQERGEYWIAPISPVLIEPKATEAFQNFQISFIKQASGQAVTVEGIVLCNNQEVNFSANNRIAVSF